MNATQCIKRHIILDAIERGDLTLEEGSLAKGDIDAVWDWWYDEEGDQVCEYMDEFRWSGEEVDIPAPGSGIYESTSHVRKLSCGTYVGWTYWYGGGKHGSPEEMEWLEDAYFVRPAGERVIQLFEKVKEVSNER